MKVFSFEPLWSSRRQVPYRVIGIFCHRATQDLLVSVLPVAITSLSQNVGEGVYRGLVAYFASVAFDLFRLSHHLLPIGLIGSLIANHRPRQASRFTGASSCFDGIGLGHGGNVAMATLS